MGAIGWRLNRTLWIILILFKLFFSSIGFSAKFSWIHCIILSLKWYRAKYMVYSYIRSTSITDRYNCFQFKIEYLQYKFLIHYFLSNQFKLWIYSVVIINYPFNKYYICHRNTFRVRSTYIELSIIENTFIHQNIY